MLKQGRNSWNCWLDLFCQPENGCIWAIATKFIPECSCQFELFKSEVSSAALLGEPGTKGTKPRPPKTGLMNLSSNFLQRWWTVDVGCLMNNWSLLRLGADWLLPLSTGPPFSRDKSLRSSKLAKSFSPEVNGFALFRSTDWIRGFVTEPKTCQKCSRKEKIWLTKENEQTIIYRVLKKSIYTVWAHV